MMINKLLLSLLFLLCATGVFSQIEGRMTDKDTGAPLAYVNIGVVGRDVGTVSRADGSYNIQLPEELDADSIRFSFIGYAPVTMQVADFRRSDSYSVALAPLAVDLTEVVVRPMKLSPKHLGNIIKSKKLQAGFEHNNKGYELGVMLRIEKRAVLTKLNLHVNTVSYDSLFYRLNVYKILDGEHNYENILHRPIYLRKAISKKRQVITFDLKEYDLVVDGNTLVTLEYVDDMGEGILMFASSPKGETSCFRKTSQGDWTTLPIVLGISVDALVEK